MSERKMWSLSCIFAALLWFFIVPQIKASGQYTFTTWTTEQGLPQNSVHDIVQTRDGYLWLTTSDGLARFDGVHFTVFNRTNSPGLVSNRVTALFEDRAGDLWVGSEDAGVSRLHKGVFTAYGTSTGLPSGWIKGISQAASGRMLVLVREGVMGLQNGRFRSVRTDGFPNNGLNYRIISSGVVPGFWSQNSDRVALYFHEKTSILQWPKNRKSAVADAVAEDERGTLWVTGGGLLFRERDGLLESIALPTACRSSRDATFVAAARLEFACRVSNGSLIIRTLSTPEQKVIPNFAKAPREALHDMTFVQDRGGAIWIGIGLEGLGSVQKQTIRMLSEKQGLHDHNVYPILQDRSGAVWIGAWHNTVNRYFRGKFRYFTPRDGLVPNPTALYKDRSGKLWVASYAPDSLRVLKNGRFVPVPGLRNLGIIHAIAQDSQGGFWFGCEDQLVHYQNGQVRIFRAKDGLATGSVSVLVPDKSGGMWIGGYGGVTHYTHGHFHAYRVSDGLPSAHVRTIYVDDQRTVWIGTYDSGLARLKNGNMACFSMSDGLFSNGVFQILDDLHGNFWMSSNQGIYRVRKQDLNDFAEGRIKSFRSRAYTTRDGMLTLECNGGQWPAGIRTADGNLWFPTQDGVAIVDPSNLSIETKPPQVVIESAVIDRKPVSIEDAIYLQPSQRDLEIKYTAFSPVDPQLIDFKYRLEGLDRSWTDAGFRRTAYYSHLPAGSYTFRIIAANADGIWNTEGKTLLVIVQPHFYRTLWFDCLVALTLLGIFYLVWIRHMAVRDAAFAAQREFSHQLIAHQEIERKRIAAELHDSIGQRLAMMKSLASLSSSREEENSTAQNLRLKEIASEAGHAMRDIRDIAYKLRPYQLDILGLTKAIEGLLKKTASSTSIALSFSVDEIDHLLPAEMEINFYRIVQEGISNVLRHSQATRAEIVVRSLPGSIDLTIQDNGQGFDLHAEEADRAGGFGFRSIAERVVLLGGKLSTASSPQNGTRIDVQIPISN